MFSEGLFDKIIKFSFYLLFFLIPLILTPWNYELFEFNKMLFVYGMTVIIVGAWLGKMIIRKKIEIQQTPLDIPLSLYLASCILSTLFSVEPHTSIWGYYSRFHGGLLSTISYILLYYAFVTNMRETKQSSNKTINCIHVLLASAFLATFYGILEHLGIDAKYWIQDVRNRVFSTLGQPNWLGAFIDTLIFIPLGLALQSKNKSSFMTISFYILYIIYFLCLIFTSSKSAIFSFLVWLSNFLSFFIKKVKKTINIRLASYFNSLYLNG